MAPSSSHGASTVPLGAVVPWRFDNPPSFGTSAAGKRSKRRTTTASRRGCFIATGRRRHGRYLLLIASGQRRRGGSVEAPNDDGAMVGNVQSPQGEGAMGDGRSGAAGRRRRDGGAPCDAWSKCRGTTAPLSGGWSKLFLSN